MRDRLLIICDVLHTDTDHRSQTFFEGTDYVYFSITGRGLIPKTEILGDAEYINRNYPFVHETHVDALMKLVAP